MKQKNKTKKAIVLVSGGLDSATTLAIARDKGFEIYALSFDYGQKHKSELLSAKKVCTDLEVKEHLLYKMDVQCFAASALTKGPQVPKARSEKAIANGGIPVTYVPARNTVFLSIALAWAETIGAHDIFIGVNAIDYSGYPDCRPAFIKAFEKTANLATKEGVSGNPFRVHTPLIRLTKSQIIKTGVRLGVDYGLTSSCYSPLRNGKACGNCDACTLRLKGFREAGYIDPANYV